MKHLLRLVQLVNEVLLIKLICKDGAIFILAEDKLGSVEIILVLTPGAELPKSLSLTKLVHRDSLITDKVSELKVSEVINVVSEAVSKGLNHNRVLFACYFYIIAEFCLRLS
jgi:hypothetical protein